jgi:4-phospho-D-threonate 3-dehydrogenase / 4-phospho-D-erythronate 3-dehydrogenase
MTVRGISDERPILAITMGDPAGVGPEIAVRACMDVGTYRISRPIVIGDAGVIRATLDGMGAKLSMHSVADVADARFTAGQIDVLDLHNVDLAAMPRAQVSAMAGQAAYEYIIRGIDLAMAGTVDAVVTCPIHKDALNQAGHHYPGHTEIFAERTGTDDFAMMLVAGGLRVVLVTIHVALREAIDMIDEERIVRAIRLAHEAGMLMGIENPRIAVPGLNPHAGESGMFGREETEIIEPAIARAKAEGYNAQGPFPPDTVFHRAHEGQFDFVTPMYHDQGLIPIKLIGFGGGVNVTLGLPIIRTSVDHGTAFGKAWQFRANAGSMMEAMRLAVQMASVRRRRRARAAR